MWLQKQHPGVRGQKLQLGGIRSFQGSITPGANLSGSPTENNLLYSPSQPALATLSRNSLDHNAKPFVVSNPESAYPAARYNLGRFLDQNRTDLNGFRHESSSRRKNWVALKRV